MGKKQQEREEKFNLELEALNKWKGNAIDFLIQILTKNHSLLSEGDIALDEIPHPGGSFYYPWYRTIAVKIGEDKYVIERGPRDEKKEDAPQMFKTDDNNGKGYSIKEAAEKIANAVIKPVTNYYPRNERETKNGLIKVLREEFGVCLPEKF